MTTYRIHGITDETDTCELCGKVELRSVVMLAALDDDGNIEEIIYAGSTCGPRKLATRGKRVTAKRFVDAARAADRVMAQAREFVAEFEGFTLNQYLAANATGLMNANGHDMAAALLDGKVRYAELLVELDTIRAGSLVGTRFEAKLPTL